MSHKAQHTAWSCIHVYVNLWSYKCAFRSYYQNNIQEKLQSVIQCIQIRTTMTPETYYADPFTHTSSTALDTVL